MVSRDSQNKNVCCHFITSRDRRFFSCSLSSQAILQEDFRTERRQRLWSGVGSPETENAQGHTLHRPQRTPGHCCSHWVRRSEGKHRAFPHALIRALLHGHWQSQSPLQVGHGQLPSQLHRHRHGALPVRCEWINWELECTFHRHISFAGRKGPAGPSGEWMGPGDRLVQPALRHKPAEDHEHNAASGQRAG